jgi:hypothetical protein
MMTTFARWPVPPEGRVSFAARCPCGREALWEQVGARAADGYRITCPRCVRSRAGTSN